MALLAFVFALVGIAYVQNFAYAQSFASFFNAPAQSILAQWILTAMAGVINNITAALGRGVLVLIEAIVVPILQYNAFSSSHTIGLGWSLVRDVVNMGVVIVLLYIAITTMVGVASKNWQQSLPQLFLAVVLLNFSRTICGLLIDVSQVVMFTFVNAVLDIAAGNFAQLLGLQSFGQFSTNFTNNVALGTDILTASVALGAAYLQFGLYAAIFAIMLLLALAFIYRIIVLWILVIMSPIAFFLYGLRPLGIGGGAWGNWAGKFSGALVMGPMLTFFLWLSLAAASSGSIVSSETFPVPKEPSSYGLPLAILESHNITGLLLALVLLVVGMQQAASSAQAVGGWAGSLISEQRGRSIVGGLVGAPVRYGARVAKKRVAPPVTAGVGRAAIRAGEFATRTGVPGLGALGAGLVTAGGAVQRYGEKTQEAERKVLAEKVANYTDDERLANIRRISAPGYKGALTEKGRLEDEQILLRYGSNIGDRIKAGKNMSDDEKAKMNERTMRFLENNQGLIADAQRPGVNKFKSQQLHQVGITNRKTDYDKNVLDDEQMKEIKKFVDSDDYSPRVLSKEAIADVNVRTVLDKKVSRTRKNDGDTFTEISELEEIRSGARGKQLQEWLEEIEKGTIPPPSSSTTRPKASRPTKPKKGGGGSSGGGSSGGSKGSGGAGGPGPGSAPPTGGTPPVTPTGTGGGTSASPRASSPVVSASAAYESTEEVTAGSPPIATPTPRPPTRPPSPSASATPIKVKASAPAPAPTAKPTPPPNIAADISPVAERSFVPPKRDSDAPPPPHIAADISPVAERSFVPPKRDSDAPPPPPPDFN